jgi:hypothetical protein
MELLSVSSETNIKGRFKVEKTRFSFNSQEHNLAEVIENTNIVMYWERSREICPHCKELIVKGEHNLFSTIEIWIPSNKSEQECTTSDLVIIGKNEYVTLLLDKTSFKEAIKCSKKFGHLGE